MSFFGWLSSRWAVLHESASRLRGRRFADGVVLGILLIFPILAMLIGGTIGAIITLLVSSINIISVTGESMLRIARIGGRIALPAGKRCCSLLREEFPLIVLCVFVLCILVNFGAVYASLERMQPRQHLGGTRVPVGLFDSIYYSFSVMTTVGFGDVHPISIAAKTLTMAQMLSVFLLVFVALSLVAERKRVSRE